MVHYLEEQRWVQLAHSGAREALRKAKRFRRMVVASTVLEYSSPRRRF